MNKNQEKPDLYLFNLMLGGKGSGDNSIQPGSPEEALYKQQEQEWNDRARVARNRPEIAIDREAIEQALRELQASRDAYHQEILAYDLKIVVHLFLKRTTGKDCLVYSTHVQYGDENLVLPAWLREKFEATPGYVMTSEMEEWEQ